MNIAKLNSTNKDVIKKAGASSSMKYYDCLMDVFSDGHETYVHTNAKVILPDGSVEIYPEANSYGEEGIMLIACALDLGTRIYRGGEWHNIKDYVADAEGFDISAHPEITEEEFYSIPKDETFVLNTEEDIKALYDKIDSLFARYGDLALENGIFLSIWYKSMTFVHNGGTTVLEPTLVAYKSSSYDAMTYWASTIISINDTISLVHEYNDRTGEENYIVTL